jgi:SAM-dependent methyltransferase
VHPSDVPSPIDLCDTADAREWERTAQSRPGRAEMFQAFANQLGRLGRPDIRVLDLGAGPGFLAEFLLTQHARLTISLLDFSPPMHELAQIRLKNHATQVRYLRRSFKDPDWIDGIGPFDAVVTNQAVHELRHKRYAEALHCQVKAVLASDGTYLVCDHFYGDGGMSNDQLYMSISEQRDALSNAGFKSVQQIHRIGTLVMHRAA